MTAKEKLLERVTRLTEEEAAETLTLLEDPVIAAFRAAPEDDEPWTEADEAAVREADEDPAPSIPLQQVKREFGIG